jgi:hypothetical protein
MMFHPVLHLKCGFVAIGQSEDFLQTTEQLIYKEENNRIPWRGLKLHFRVFQMLLTVVSGPIYVFSNIT